MRAHELERQLEALHESAFTWALRCCGGNRSDAEDALQTTYLKILEGRARYDGASSLKTWLFAVIRNTARSTLRRRALRDGLLLRSGSTAAPAAAADPSSQLDRARRNRALAQARAGLSPRQAELVELVFDHELSVRDAAGVLGISVGSARTHYDRAKKQLARVLDEGWR